MGRRGEPSFSIRAMRPFLRVLDREPGISKRALEQLNRCDPDGRIPVRTALKLLERAVALTGDEALGLRAAPRSSRGEFDLIEFVVASSATYRECISLIRRYIRLLNDAVELEFEIREGMAIGRWNYKLPMNRVARDFGMATLYLGFARRTTAIPEFPLEVCFTHEQPDDIRLYRWIFRPGKPAIRRRAPPGLGGNPPPYPVPVGDLT